MGGTSVLRGIVTVEMIICAGRVSVSSYSGRTGESGHSGAGGPGGGVTTGEIVEPARIPLEFDDAAAGQVQVEPEDAGDGEQDGPVVRVVQARPPAGERGEGVVPGRVGEVVGCRKLQGHRAPPRICTQVHLLNI
jgi:hypothetical protein